MKERPILFSSEMVKALLAGKKTQTRRAVKIPKVNLPYDVRGDGPWRHTCALSGTYTAEMNPYGAVSVRASNGELLGLRPREFDWVSPYGVVGDRLWVQENHTIRSLDRSRRTVGIRYEADDARHLLRLTEAELAKFEARQFPYRAQPGRFLYRSLSRIALEITGVRAEPLQAISLSDALEEGVLSLGRDWLRPLMPDYVVEVERVEAEHARLNALGQRLGYPKPPLGPSPVERYRLLWEQINGKESWSVNPLVWAISFKRAEVSV